MNEIDQHPIAILIDGESLPAIAWPQIRMASGKLGKPNIARVFGDFSNSSHAAWLQVCRKEGVEPVIHCPAVAGKNGADMMLAIAAMDLLHQGYRGAIVLASNDRDFLPLARRLRESGVTIHGLALRRANEAEAAIFSTWKVIEIKKTVTSKAACAMPVARVQKPKAAMLELANALNAILAQDQAMSLSQVGKKLAERWPELHKSIGKNKLKTRILKDAPGVQINGVQVRRA